ncbi:hypothetical protein JCM10213_000027 [Rhodosporidiobolus nylandii]
MSLARSCSLLWDALRGQYGSIGLYSAVQRLFVAFGVTAGPACLLVDAPFGRFLGDSTWTIKVNGRIGWLLMEIVSPLSFLYFLSTPPSTSPFAFPAPSFARILSAFSSLPAARRVLAVFYLVHYANRSIVSELRNPGRAAMDLVIPVISALFNAANGGTIGLYLGGGLAGAHPESGLRPNSASNALFAVGAALWLAGFASNIYHDNVLFRLKAEKQAEGERQAKKRDSPSSPHDAKSRYAIPQGGLYRFLSHPSYTSEWVEWSGFTLCTLALAPAPFPPSRSSPSLAALPALLRPLQAWYLQPPALFVLQEISAMLPRARSGHRWYRKTFGAEWEEKGAKWIVLPGLY